MKRLSAHELRAARKAQDWNTLWEQAIPLVKFTMSSFVRGGMNARYATDDALQAAYLAVGQAVRTWDPEKGQFSTWISVRAQGAIMNHITSDISMVGGRRQSVVVGDDIEDDVLEDEGSLGAQVELEEEETARTVRDWLFQHSDDPLDHEIVCYRFGLGTYPLLSIVEIAARVKRPYRTVKRRLQKSLRELARLAEKWGYLDHERENT